MILRKRFYKALSLALILGTLMSTGVSAKTISDSLSGNINLSMSTDGFFSATSSYTGGRVLYSYKYGTSQDNLQSPVFPKNMPIKFFNADGSLNHESNDLGGTPVFTKDNYTSWIPAGYSVSVPTTSDYNKAEGYKVIQGTKKVDNNDWFMLGSPTDKGYIEIDAIYAYDNGTYSDPVSKVFYYDKDTIKSASTPDLKVAESKRTSSEVTLKLTSATKDASTNLSYIIVNKANGTKDDIKLTGQSNEQDYTIKANGIYTFSLYSSTGECSTVVWDEQKIAGVGSTASATTESAKPPVVTFSGIPDSAKAGESFIMHVNTDQESTVNVDGVTYENTKSVDVEIKDNGTYTYHVVGKNGLSSDASVTITCFPESADGGYHIDIASYWKKTGSVLTDNKLPQTGGIAFGTALAVGVAMLGSGVFMIRKKKEDTTQDSNK